ncbi:MAG: bifunctional demethylmenaquinone methyltransferase/2-methoxy-6-polyprenyl-1,4-benzoquinol methylase UbiE [Geminicoccaceae bacterium]
MTDPLHLAQQRLATSFGYQEVRPEDKPLRVGELFQRVAGRYDLMNDLMSVGVHRLWKAAMIDWLAPRPGLRLLDVAGGTGDVAFRTLDRLARRREAAPEILVCDRSPAMLEVGRDRAIDSNRHRTIQWLCGDAEALPLAERSVDAYTIAFGIRNVTRIEKALAEARRVLRPGGRFLCLEFSTVRLPGLDRLYDAYSFSVLPWLGQRVALDRAAYQYLAESIRRFPDQATFARLIERAGLERVRYRNLSGGIAALHSAWRL